MKNSLKQVLAAALVGGALVVGGNAYAAPTGDGAADFKAAYIISPEYGGAMTTGINLFGPQFHGDVDGKGQILKDGTVRFEGKLDWIFTNKDNNKTTNKSMPIFLEQRNGAMNLYVYRNYEWNKYPLPGVPAGIFAALKSTDAKVLGANMEVVKSAKKIAEQNGKKTFKLVLDGKKLSVAINKNANFPKGEQAVFVNRLSSALNKTDLEIDWTVDAATGKTATINGNLTPILREYAKGVIDEMASGKIKLNDEEKNFYAALGYYAEMPFFIAIGTEGNQDSVMTPVNLNSAKDNKDVLADIRKDIASTPTK
ncbi:MAG: hypothetical protein IKN12_07835 [Selenomonadaceae bacterium]|nr:hypothetical protein [Selenomonadaceae bacterium]